MQYEWIHYIDEENQQNCQSQVFLMVKGPWSLQEQRDVDTNGSCVGSEIRERQLERDIVINNAEKGSLCCCVFLEL